MHFAVKSQLQNSGYCEFLLWTGLRGNTGPTWITTAGKRPEQPVIKAAWQAAVEAKNQLPLVSVSLQNIWFPPPRPVTANFSRSSSPKGRWRGGGTGPGQECCQTPKLLPFGTKMSLSLVFAPAQVVEEMAEALPVCLGGRTTVHHLPTAKQAQKANCCHAR